MNTVTNFGRNVRFEPSAVYEPSDESELLDILERHANGSVRVVASRHAWSEAIVSQDALVSMRRFDHVRVEERPEGPVAIVGAGCQVKHLLAALRARGLTMPSVGLITEQTIAGATSTGTHGSGKHSLSHYLQAVRVACYGGSDGAPEIRDVTEGAELRAARCGLGCLGIVVEVTLPCVPQYSVREQSVLRPTIEEVLALESETPLQQFFLVPHRWQYAVQRRVAVEGTGRSWTAPLYRGYWFASIDVGMHVMVKAAAAWLRSRWLTRFLFRRLVPLFVLPWWTVTDRSDRQLVMEHELFRHLELEAFVPDVHVAEASRFVTEVLKQADGAGGMLEEGWARVLDEAGLHDDFETLAGTFTHHYPVCFRRILRDDTLISMASGSHEAWYSISFITYVEPRDAFYGLATYLARSLHALFGARLHWGKWFPLAVADVEDVYPELPRFREVAERFDPRCVFRNEYVRRALGFAEAAGAVPTGATTAAE